VVVGWGSLSSYNPRGGYARTVENSVYTAHDARRQGIGSLMLGELIALARTHGHHLIVAGIDAAQDASVALHTRFGFTHAGRLPEAGYKFGRWLDVIYMELRP
jgi:phosphinothricin acetyltransferase